MNKIFTQALKIAKEVAAASIWVLVLIMSFIF